MSDRQYQTDLKNNIYKDWNRGAKNVLGVLPTGGGKTWVFSEVVAEHNGPAVAIAHRQEIVSQIAMSFAEHGIKHSIIAPDAVVRQINRMQLEELGTSFFHPSAKVAVAGVDTLIRRKNIAPWAKSVSLWVQDEAHHVLKGNKWGKAADLFPNAKGLGVTATPCRADGKGLGRHVDGLFDSMVLGPDMRFLINKEFLTDYRIFAPPSDLDLSTVKTGADGDYSRPSLKTAVRKSQIIGDVVKHYLKIAPGKRGITFATDVETAGNIADQFNAAGVPAEMVHGGTKDLDRARVLRKFRSGELLQLVNVDLFGEGFDLPAVEVVSMARPTQSFGLYCQQFGRALRLIDGKQWAIVIDHVGNVTRHGLPDAPKVWSLDRRERVSRGTPSDVIPVKACPKCTAVYERVYKTCPYCSYEAKPAARSGPEFVDGDLSELDPSVLAAMRGDAVSLTMTTPEYWASSGTGRLPHIAASGAANRFKEKQGAQVELRESIALWAGRQRSLGRPDSESYRRFYFMFGTDVLSAQALGTKQAKEMKLNIDKSVSMR